MNGCSHEWTYNGWSEPRPSTGACERPVEFVCTLCGSMCWKQCYSLGCESCAELKRGDLKAVFRSGASVNPADRLYFVTLTGPGDKRPTRSGFVLRWNRAACSHGPEVDCEASLGCEVLTGDLASWHAGLRKRWSYFGQSLRRELGCDVQVVGVWEAQRRGALHRHALVRVNGPVTERAFRAAVASYRDAFDWGRRSDVQVIDSSDPRAVAIVAGYLGKYCVKSYGSLGDVPCGFDLSAPGGSVVTRARFRGWSATARWGATLKQCRERRVAYWRGAQTGVPVSTAPAAVGGLDPYLNLSTILGGGQPSVTVAGVV